MASTAHAGVLDVRTPAGLRAWPAFVGLAAGAIVWEAASRAWEFPYQPSIPAIAAAVWRLVESGEMLRHLGSSALVLLIAYGGAVLCGVPLGLALGRYRRLAAVLDPYVDALIAMPNLLLVPILFGMFGLSRATHVGVVFLDACVVITTMARSGLAAVTAEYVEMARAFGASDVQVLRRVLLPAALPAIMAGLRLGISRAVRALIGTEMLLGPVGLGSLLRQYGIRFDAASVYGILVVVIAFALAVNYAVWLVDRRVNRWAN